MEFAELRDLMVTSQLIPRGIRDVRVLNAIRKVPRHLFVNESLQHKAYDDMALPIGEGQTISQPYMVSVMTELLALKGDEKVLEIGTGSGYQSAVLAELTKEVFTIERIESLAHKAEELFHSLGYTNIRGKVGDGTLGWIEEAPFSRIIITAGAPVIPETLKDQLSEDGAILAPVGNRFSQQLLLITRHRETFVEEYHTPCVFVPLIGEFGWKKEEL